MDMDIFGYLDIGIVFKEWVKSNIYANSDIHVAKKIL